jgi:NDP-sugar pyrophosphorylase family protein
MSPAGPGPTDRSSDRSSLTDVSSVLLCGGIGKRLRPYTDSIPKALVPVAGRPIVDYHLEAWRAAGVRHALLVIGHRGDQIREHVGDGQRYGLSVEYVPQVEPRGSGDALLSVAGRVATPWLLVGYCDVFFGPRPAVWTRLLADRRAKIVGAEVPNAAAYGRLLTDEERPWARLRAIREKDGEASPGVINGGAYLLPRRVVEILASVPLSPRGEIELTDGVTQYLREGGEVRVVPVVDWIDIGTPEQLEIATQMVRSRPEERGR